jgi:hypothetical protein
MGVSPSLLLLPMFTSSKGPVAQKVKQHPIRLDHPQFLAAPSSSYLALALQLERTLTAFNIAWRAFLASFTVVLSMNMPRK